MIPSATKTNILPMKRFLITSVLFFSLYACGGSSNTESNPNTSQNQGADPTIYTGLSATTSDVSAFKIHLWNRLVANNRCGGCHGVDGQEPMFVRNDNINTAYSAANTVVNLSDPAASQMVLKVAGGHNCWESNNNVCADVIAGYITDWANDSIGGSGNSVLLQAPEIKEPGASKNFPADNTLFVAHVYPLLTQYCSDCHSESGLTPQSPYFASSDEDTAYAAALSKMNLDVPALSRFVLRLGGEFHNCWDDCSANASEMESAIADMAALIADTTVDEDLVISKALQLTDGIITSSGGRQEANIIALYEFKVGEGLTAFDTSGVDPALNLTLSGDVSWIGGWGVQLAGGKAQGSTQDSKKLHDLITASGEYTIETWVAPGNVSQEGPARIVSYSAGNNARNFTLGQSLYNYNFLNRSSLTDGNGMPALSTLDAEEVLQATLQHVVTTFDPVNGERVYVNGERVDLDPAQSGVGANLSDWDDSFAFILGSEASNENVFHGAIRFVAIHNRALNQDQITQNFEIGVGERFYLLFSVGDIINVPDTYVVFEVSQFDSFSYLFNQPFFIGLAETIDLSNTPLQGMRIGINGKEAIVGQAYQHLDLILNNASYSTEKGIPLSGIGTIIALEKGPTADEFFLSFEQLGDEINVVTEPALPTPVEPSDLDKAPEIGLRLFTEINASMANMTGISKNNSNVLETYERIKQQMPTVEDLSTFLAAHQVAVSQLGIEYCNELLEDSGKRSLYFSGFNFTGSDFNATAQQQIIDPLLENMLNADLTNTIELSSQPSATNVRTELNNLIGRLDDSCAGGTCSTERTTTIVKAVCAATISSAALLLQ